MKYGTIINYDDFSEEHRSRWSVVTKDNMNKFGDRVMRKICVLWLLTFICSGAFTVVSADPNKEGDPELEINILAKNIISGMEISITKDGRVFIAEREGKVKLYNPRTEKPH